MTRVITAALFAIMATTASAQQNCGQREAVADRLASQFGETRQSIGLGAGGMVETWANRLTGSFTITVTTPSGLTCLVSSGEAFERLTEVIPPQGSKS